MKKNIFFEKTSAPEPIHLMTEVTSILGSIREMPIFRTRSDCARYPAAIGLRCLRGNTPQNTAIRRGVILTKNVLQKKFFWEEMMENDTFKCYNGNI